MSGKYVLFLILLNYLMYLVMKKGTKKKNWAGNKFNSYCI